MIPVMPPSEDAVLVLERQRYDARRAVLPVPVPCPRCGGAMVKRLGCDSIRVLCDECATPTQAELARMHDAERDEAEQRRREYDALRRRGATLRLERMDDDPRTWPVEDQRRAGIEYYPDGRIRGTSYGWGGY